jgi:hypothetical protein
MEGAAVVPGTYGGAAVAGAIAVGGRTVAGPFDVAIACALLAGDPDRGLRYVAEGLAAGPPPLDDPAWPDLLKRLEQHPFVSANRAREYGYAGDPRVVDAALGLAAGTGVDARRDWLLGEATICRAIRRRTQRLAQEIDLAAARHAGAPVVGVAAGHARELAFSVAVRQRRVAPSLLEPDARAHAAARRLLADLAVESRHVPLFDVMSGAVRPSGCSLVYAPTLAEHLPLDSLLDVVAATVAWLRPGGQVVVPFHTALPEAGFLRWVAGWTPNVLRTLDVLEEAREIDGAVARVEQDAAHGLAYLYLERAAVSIVGSCALSGRGAR